MIEFLKKEIGKNAVVIDPKELAKFQFSGKTADLLFYPDTVEAIAKIMTYANRDDKKVLIAGNNSQRHFGATTEQPDWVVSLTKMNALIEHDVADLNVTVQAGVGLAQLQKNLKKANQFLPLEGFSSDKRTLGGIIATNTPGFWQPGYGNCRDMVLGVKVVLPDGTIIRAGGKTVKNVAGYDLSKLFIGTFGTLGIIAEITFKLFPIPAKSQTTVLGFQQAGDGASFIHKISSSNLSVSRYEYVNRVFAEQFLGREFSAKQNHNFLLTVAGHPVMVRETTKKIIESASNYDVTETVPLTVSEDKKLWRSFGEATHLPGSKKLFFGARISFPKSRLAEAIPRLEKFASQQNMFAAIHAHAFNGILTVFFVGDEVKEFTIPRPRIESLREKISALDGKMAAFSIPLDSHSAELAWGKQGNSFGLMNAVKAKYDPNRVLVSGRFVGGL